MQNDVLRKPARRCQGGTAGGAGARAAELGIAPGDVFAWLRQQMPVGKGTRTRKPRDDIGAKRAAKYRGPNGEEWSGRGRTPKWLAVLEAEGEGERNS
jgi:DNA-binding protein H-NS